MVLARLVNKQVCVQTNLNKKPSLSTGNLQFITVQNICKIHKTYLEELFGGCQVYVAGHYQLIFFLVKKQKADSVLIETINE